MLYEFTPLVCHRCGFLSLELWVCPLCLDSQYCDECVLIHCQMCFDMADKNAAVNTPAQGGLFR